jgi:hypothetical protein
MKDILTSIWDFPAHHVSLGWWLALALALLSVKDEIVSWIGRFSKWGRQFQVSQLRIKIKVIEYLHDNADRLIRYLVNDAVQIVIELCLLLMLYAVFFFREANLRPFVAILIVNAVAIIIGPTLRIRALIHDLRDYPESVENLKAKLKRLET